MSDTVDVNVTLSKEELEAIELIMFKKNQAKLMLDRTDFPEDMDSITRASFFKAAGDLASESSLSEKTWWEEIAKSYNLEGQPLSLNTETGVVTKGTVEPK